MSSDMLPRWRSVLAVVAHPDDESFALGAVLSLFADSGTVVWVLCLTRGEASTLHGVLGDLGVLRQKELSDAADALGVTRVVLRSFPDGALEGVPSEELEAEVRQAAVHSHADGVVAFDLAGVTGHRDHTVATQAALAAAGALGLPVLGWTLPTAVADVLNAEFGASFSGHDAADLDVFVKVDRSRQRRAVACHASQAVPGSVLWRRLELLADTEHLRWLTASPSPATEVLHHLAGATAPAPTTSDRTSAWTP